MNTLLTLLLFIFILGITVFVHELGHFLFAKLVGVHVYEFSLGFGPVLFKHIAKDKTQYSISLYTCCLSLSFVNLLKKFTTCSTSFPCSNTNCLNSA